MEIFAVIFANNKLFKIKIDKIILKMNYVVRKLGRLIILSNWKVDISKI